jgi:hypothetical protein
MPEYIIWYQRKIKADNIKKAISQESKHKLEFHSIVEKDDKTVQGTSAIGFQYEPDDEYDDY